MTKNMEKEAILLLCSMLGSNPLRQGNRGHLKRVFTTCVSGDGQLRYKTQFKVSSSNLGKEDVSKVWMANMS